MWSREGPVSNSLVFFMVLGFVEVQKFFSDSDTHR